MTNPPKENPLSTQAGQPPAATTPPPATGDQPRQDPPNPAVAAPFQQPRSADPATDARLTALGAEVAGLRNQLAGLNGKSAGSDAAIALTVLAVALAFAAVWAVSKRTDRVVGKLNGLADELHELARSVNP